MFRYTKLTLLREVLVIIATLAMMSPFYVLIATALKPRGELLTTSPVAWPEQPTLDAFTTLLTGSQTSQIWEGLFNSLIMTAGAIVGLVVVGSATAYVLVRKGGKSGGLLFGLVIVGIVVPAQLGLVPLYVGARTLGLLGSLWGMIILYVGMLLPLAIFLYSGFIRAIPPDYEEAARIDGASRLRLFSSVVFPLLAPATGTVAIMTGLIVWNDFFTPLVFLSGTDAATLPVVMYSFVGSLTTRWDLVFATVIVSMVPILTFYLFAQKQFIQGFAGGVKA